MKGESHNMEKKFEKPEAIIVTLVNDDIITSSTLYDPLTDNGDEGELE